MKNPASLLLAIAVGSVAVMALAKASGKTTPLDTRIANVGGRLYRVRKLDDGRYLVEEIGTENALVFRPGETATSCKGDCNRILVDMQEFPKDLMA